MHRLRQSDRIWDIFKNRPVAVKKLLTRIQKHCENSDRVVEECRKFMLNNWGVILAAFHDKHALGCSAEGHVSSIYSERMSSRPMGWSESGKQLDVKNSSINRQRSDTQRSKEETGLI